MHQHNNVDDMAGACRLAEKIRAARVNKERSLQLQEKAALVAQEAEYDRVYDKVSSNRFHQRSLSCLDNLY